ncbi:nicotianamine synthase family protein [Clostridium formicaceticum]|uniref:Nicotianamine synthase protein n=1 Tax=Clostridium formicaceticum TaxID=1497 RepID=A0AAC9RMV0_9CLOT|nr:nicotianamine synthase family protein [Clostridium formicaceticum]AOY74583.1 rRNA methyltransferase [Clostridium formicaceticum]ARE88946.1 Nicotianamine synthase protein [Clostridium formicaceticum]
MSEQAMFITQLDSFLIKFKSLHNLHKQKLNNYREMEKIIGEFTSFVLNKKNEAVWQQLEPRYNEVLAWRVEELREQSALCVCAMEKYRAIELQRNKQDITDYFNNIESCIKNEFGSFEITSDSKVLLIGSGAFPMTPLLIAKKTGAEVVGIDIDPEAISLGKIVVNILNKNARITLNGCSVDHLDFTKEASHIIICSIIREKFDILKQLHALTPKDVVVSMRYGNGIKSLFNYPLQKVDHSLWNLVDSVSQSESVFDIALYKKSGEI